LRENQIAPHTAPPAGFGPVGKTYFLGLNDFRFQGQSMIPTDYEKSGPPDKGSDQSIETGGTPLGTLEQLLACATDFDRTAGPSTDAEEWFRAESESLLQWAEKTGKFLRPAEFRDLIEGFKLLEGGLEHQVFFRKRSGRVFKITKAPHFGHTWYLKDYVQNLIWCNLAFEDDFRL